MLHYMQCISLYLSKRLRRNYMSKKKAQIEIKAGWEQKLITSSRLAHYQKQNLDSLVNNMDLTKVFNPLRIYKTNWLDKAYSL